MAGDNAMMMPMLCDFIFVKSVSCWDKNFANANAVNSAGLKAYDMIDDVELVKLFSEELGMPNLRTIKELLEEEQFDVVAKRFQINMIQLIFNIFRFIY